MIEAEEPSPVSVGDHPLPPQLRASHDPRRRRRERAQRPRREAEARARRLALDYVGAARTRGFSASFAACQLRVSPRTVRHWACHAARAPACRGRPCRTTSRENRQEVLRFLREVSGPLVGLESLRALFPNVARCVLADVLRRARRVWRRRYRQRGFRLTWHQAGRVWAIDFSEASQPIDGRFTHLLAVRDLASHQQLAWQPVTQQTAAAAIGVLEQLFRDHGPPLILKSDNGSAFIAEEFRALLEQHQVLPLFSPARHPQYNGALERSNGTLKTYTQQHAATHGRPHRWTSDDVESARQLANTVSRPWGYRGATPDEAWLARIPITVEERATFQDAVARERAVASADLALDPAAELQRTDETRRDRLALARALTATGNLSLERVDRPPKKPPRRSRPELARLAAEHRTSVASPSVESPSAAEPFDAEPFDAGAEPVDEGAAGRNPSVEAPAPALPAEPSPNAVLPIAPPDVPLTERRSHPVSGADGSSTARRQHCQHCSPPRPSVRPAGPKFGVSNLIDNSPLGAADKNLLASSAPNDKMNTSEDVPGDEPIFARAPPPAHGERAFPSWLRRAITPLLRRAKAAIFTWV